MRVRGARGARGPREPAGPERSAENRLRNRKTASAIREFHLFALGTQGATISVWWPER